MSFGSSLVVFEKAKQSKVCHLGIRKSIYCNSNGDAFEDTPLSYFQFLSLCHPTPSSLSFLFSLPPSLYLSLLLSLSLSLPYKVAVLGVTTVVSYTKNHQTLTNILLMKGSRCTQDFLVPLPLTFPPVGPLHLGGCHLQCFFLLVRYMYIILLVVNYKLIHVICRLVQVNKALWRKFTVLPVSSSFTKK